MNASALMELGGQVRRFGLCGDWRHGPGLGAMLVSGADSATFLQAQLTSDVAALAPGQGQLAARLNRRGQLQAWFSLHRLPDRGQPFPAFIAILPATEITPLLADLAAYVISEDVLLEDLTADFTGSVVQQPGDREPAEGFLDLILATADAHHAAPWSAQSENCLTITTGPDGGELWVIRRSFTGDPGFLILQPGQREWRPVASAWSTAAASLQMLDLAALDPEVASRVWDWLRAEAGWPQLGHDLAAGRRVLPQTGLDQQVVSFTKGCYLGQEVVARLRTYGTVPEALRAVIWRDLAPEELDTLPEPGARCEDENGNKLGTWAGSFWSPVLQMTASLVFLDRDNRTPGHTVNVVTPAGIAGGEVALLPLHMGANAAERATRLHDQALAHFSAHRDAEAVADLEAALRLDPTRGEAFEALGVILGRLEKYHEAIDIFRRLEEVAPDEPMVHTNLSLFYLQIGDKDEAEHQKALATMKKFGGGVDVRQAADMAAQERQARRDDAERKKIMFAEVLAIDPDDALALMGMGQALATLDETETAAEYLQRALAQQSQNSALYSSCGRVLEKLGRRAEAGEVFRRGIAVASAKGDLMPLKEMEHRLRLLGL